MIKLHKVIAIISLAFYLWAPFAQAGFLVVGKRNGSPHNPDSMTYLMLPFLATGAVIVPTSTLQDTGLNLPPQSFDTRLGLFCKDAALYSRYTFKLSHNLVPGPMFNGHQLYKTSLQGLYFDIEIINLNGAYSTFSPGTFFLPNGSMTTKAHFTAYCGVSYYEAGGVVFNFQVRYYTDSTFQNEINRNNINDLRATFASSGNVPGAPFSGAGLRFENNDGDGSYWTISLPGELYISLPTCYITAVEGPTTRGNTVDLGSFTTSEVQSNMTPAVPFVITISKCLKVSNATFRLATNKPAPINSNLLGNVFIDSSAAQGAGVQITPTDYDFTPAMEANKALSEYTTSVITSRDQYGEFINGQINMSGTSKQIHFDARLVRDGNATVKAGNFRASAIFIITYN